ncbi:MAG: ATP-binding protein [Clostridium fessum]
MDNSVDEHLAGARSQIRVDTGRAGRLPAPSGDNGRGIPVEMHKKGMAAERIVLSTLHAGGKFDNNAYKTSGGLHGVGSSVCQCPLSASGGQCI